MTTQAKHSIEYTQAELADLIGKTPDVFVLLSDLGHEMSQRHMELVLAEADADAIKVAEERKTIALVAYFAAAKLIKGKSLNKVQHINLETALEVQDLM
jgi:hypothetical protein